MQALVPLMDAFYVGIKYEQFSSLSCFDDMLISWKGTDPETTYFLRPSPCLTSWSRERADRGTNAQENRRKAMGTDGVL